MYNSQKANPLLKKWNWIENSSNENKSKQWLKKWIDSSSNENKSKQWLNSWINQFK